ncbi:hypothetical protein [Bdellovibrio sp. HCB274]|uniref:hypothetical protein n=1 Tax=Bdellovibrio sp. HCB274 TaxID=3394361 RepID=UPI0039B63452
MKNLVFALMFLVAGAASASVKSVKVCNVKNGTQSVEMSIIGKVLVARDNSNPVEESFKVMEILEASASDLKEMQSFYNLETKLVDATSYIIDYSGFVLAVDAKGVQYLLGQGGAHGTSKACK